MPSVLPPAQPAIGNWPKPNKGLLKDVFNYLLNRVQAGTELYVLSPQFIPMAVSILVQVRDPQTEQETLQAVQQVITEYLWPLPPGGGGNQGWPLGKPIQVNELLTQAARVEGVQAVTADGGAIQMTATIIVRSKPIVVIGGINNKNYKKLLLNNANFLAISGYIWNNKKYKPTEAIESLK